MCTSIGLRNSLKTGMAFRNNKQFHLKGDIYKIYSSPLPRALLTACAFTKGYDPSALEVNKIIVDSCVSESVNKIDVSKMTGSTGNSVSLTEYNKWIDVFQQMRKNKINFEFNNKERDGNRKKLHANLNKKINVKMFMKEIINPCTSEIKTMRNDNKKSIIIVTHQHFINSLLKQHFNFNQREKIANNGVVRLQFKNGLPMANSVRIYNNISKNANKSTNNISNKMEQDIKKILYISNSTENALCDHNIKSKTIIKNRNEFNNKVVRPKPGY